MKSAALIRIVLSLVVILQCSCGGVVGNIEKYSFPGVGVLDLRKSLERVYLKYPEVQKTDTSMYGMNDGVDFYFVHKDAGKTLVFRCNVISNSSYDTDLSLTSAATWGELMNIAPNMGFFEKMRYRKDFEEYIIPKVREEIRP